jgi:hypothetical protein
MNIYLTVTVVIMHVLSCAAGKAMIVDLNATHCMDMCLRFSVCFVISHFLVKEILSDVYKDSHF